MPGTLYLVPTPLGDPADLSPRARDILATADLIACEDTRETITLLRRLELHAPGKLISYHDHNEDQRTPGIIAKLLDGGRVAVVSDAGTPLLDDPGFTLVRAAIAADIEIVSIPGPSAALTGLVASGIPLQGFCHVGFLPRADGKRKGAIIPLKHHPGPLIFFEAPHRMLRFLETLIEVFGDRDACLACNLTRPYERYRRGRLTALHAELSAEEQIRGQFTIIVAPAAASGLADAAKLERALDAARLLAPHGVPRKVLAEALAGALDLPRRTVYQALIEESTG
jgi:16S rRNA (cytidine1402-2'-O)-methyltransferase